MFHSRLGPPLSNSKPWSNVTHVRQWMGHGNTEGLYFIMALDVTLQTVLAAKSLLTAITGTVEWLLTYRTG